MDLDISIDTANIQAAFARFQAMGENPRIITRQIAGILADSSEQAFADERDPETGAPWADLTPRHQARRKKGGHWPGRILQVKGLLATSLTTGYSPTTAWIGSPMKYAAIHQLGGTAGMPPGPAAISARPYMGLDGVARQEILQAIQGALTGSL
ncbi:phage virion morphogenesis protein [Aeromonas piscicola]|uniref:phage virion morphogenesis protein n=1 Tax=Aeromonas piscicola TaxID=600645 RepID=UPI0005B31F07|nr:phage virion morphogenesis protein [Aeromonas piscicola]